MAWAGSVSGPCSRVAAAPRSMRSTAGGLPPGAHVASASMKAKLSSCAQRDEAEYKTLKEDAAQHDNLVLGMHICIELRRRRVRPRGQHLRKLPVWYRQAHKQGAVGARAHLVGERQTIALRDLQEKSSWASGSAADLGRLQNRKAKPRCSQSG